ncbi:MAG TPA: CHAD domain-containing protein [Anaerolineaceae bacterium]|jgi:CHAD domain-containing protein|nr:CHAD domain-containing protein [Anaerolineaceae bacterium]
MKKPPPTDLQIFGAATLLRQLDVLLAEAPGAAAAEDIECIHRMRVATRRLRAGLTIFESQLPQKRAARWREQVQKLTRALGAARDADVQIERVQTFYRALPPGTERPGVCRLLLRMRQQRQELQPRVRRTLARFDKSGTAQSMHDTLAPVAALKEAQVSSPAGVFPWAEPWILRRLDEFLAFGQFIPQPEAEKELHECRIAGKRLRYTLEIFAECFPDGFKQPLQVLRKAQDLLGRIHDADVWRITLPELVAQERQRTLEYYGTLRPFSRIEPGLLAFGQHCQEDRRAAHAELVTAWAEWERRQIWTSLRQSAAAATPEVPHESNPDSTTAADA